MSSNGPNSNGVSPQRRVVLVGHCVPDSAMLKGVIQRAIPGAEVIRVNDQSALAPEPANADLLLVNRILDGEFADGSGQSLIEHLASDPARRAALMLVSNLPDAQQAAERAGAVPGIGKATCGSDQSSERLRRAVAHIPARNA